MKEHCRQRNHVHEQSHYGMSFVLGFCVSIFPKMTKKLSFCLLDQRCYLRTLKKPRAMRILPKMILTLYMLTWVRPFNKVFWYNPVLIDRCQLSAMELNFSKLENVYRSLWAILDTYIWLVIVTKNVYFVRYCNKRKSAKNWLKAKVI